LGLLTTVKPPASRGRYDGKRAIDKTENELWGDVVYQDRLRNTLNATNFDAHSLSKEQRKRCIGYAEIEAQYTHWDYGLANTTQWLASDGKPIKTTRYIWEQGKDNIPRQKEVQEIQNEIGAARKVLFHYGINNLQVTQEDYSGYVPVDQLANAPIVMRKKTEYLYIYPWTEKVFNLPARVSIDAGTDDSIYQLTYFQYDETSTQSVASWSAAVNIKLLPR
jgi:hypothetical protein